jgi:hypothetical protein
MEAFEIIVKKQSYKVIRNSDHLELFNVFNHAIYYIIKKNTFGVWEKVDHRFGPDDFAIDEVGDQIDKYYDYLAQDSTVSNG